MDNKYSSTGQKLDSAMVIYSLAHGTTSYNNFSYTIDRTLRFSLNETMEENKENIDNLRNKIIKFMTKNVLLSTAVVAGKSGQIVLYLGNLTFGNLHDPVKLLEIYSDNNQNITSKRMLSLFHKSRKMLRQEYLMHYAENYNKVYDALKDFPSINKKIQSFNSEYNTELLILNIEDKLYSYMRHTKNWSKELTD